MAKRTFYIMTAELEGHSLGKPNVVKSLSENRTVDILHTWVARPFNGLSAGERREFNEAIDTWDGTCDIEFHTGDGPYIKVEVVNGR